METALRRELREIDHILGLQGEAPLLSLDAPRPTKAEKRPSKVYYPSHYMLPPVIRVYRVAETIDLSRNQLAHLVASTIAFGCSVVLLVTSLFWDDLARFAEWYFWLTPVLGSLGVAIGLLLNIKDRERCHSKPH